MNNRKISLKTAIACAAIVLTVITCLFSFLTAPAHARELPAETVSVSLLSDIEDGYDTGLSEIGYVIGVPAF